MLDAINLCKWPSAEKIMRSDEFIPLSYCMNLSGFSPGVDAQLSGIINSSNDAGSLGQFFRANLLEAGRSAITWFELLATTKE